ncbi:MAG: DUF2784 family protein [Rhodobacteraceae bacterium]|nr:DUF2784 family protein [Paracoccaceae bacterium]
MTSLIILWRAIVVIHLLVVIGNVAALFVLPLLTPWYIALPLTTWILVLSTSRNLDCPLTRFENKLRNKINKPQIKGFIKHYIINIRKDT